MPIPDPSAEPRSRGASLAGLTGDSKLKAKPNFPVLFVHYQDGPTSWEVGDVDGVPTWLPVLSLYPIREGVAGVKTLAAGEDESKKYEGAYGTIAKNGGILLSPRVPVPADCLPPGVLPGFGYARETDCTGGVFYHTAWDQPRNDRTGNLHVRTDRAGFNRWRKHLVTSGQIPEPSEDVIASLVRQAEARLVSTENATETAAEAVRNRRLAKANTRVQTASNAAKPWEAPPAPEPTTPKGRKAATEAA